MSYVQTKELVHFLCNIGSIVPKAIVMFLVSYEYVKQVYDAWTASGTISKISKKKHIFREPRNSIDFEVILTKYKGQFSPAAKIQETHVSMMHFYWLLVGRSLKL
jgi:chromosome transmission fidelity protein 1